MARILHILIGKSFLAFPRGRVTRAYNGGCTTISAVGGGVASGVEKGRFRWEGMARGKRDEAGG